MPTSKGVKTEALTRNNYPLERRARAQFELISRAYEGGAFDDIVDRHAYDPATISWPIVSPRIPRPLVPTDVITKAVLARIEGLLGEDMLSRVALVAYKSGYFRPPDVWADLRLRDVGKLVRNRHSNREKRRRAAALGKGGR